MLTYLCSTSRTHKGTLLVSAAQKLDGPLGLCWPRWLLLWYGVHGLGDIQRILPLQNVNADRLRAS